VNVPHVLVFAVIGVAVWRLVAWVVSRWLWPWGPCPRCGGTGKGWGSNSKRWNRCRRCGGKPERRR